MHTKDKGDIAEASVIADLVKQGYKVALPIGESLPFDLIAIRPDCSLIRIQVKYRKIERSGTVSVKLVSIWKNSSLTRVVDYDLATLDYFAVYCPDVDAIAYVPVSELSTRRNFSLRIKPAKNNQTKGVRWFDKYSSLK